MDRIGSYLSNIYSYLIYSIMVYISAVIIRDRKLFPARSSCILVLLSSLPAFFGIYLFIRSLPEQTLDQPTLKPCPIYENFCALRF